MGVEQSRLHHQYARQTSSKLKESPSTDAFGRLRTSAIDGRVASAHLHITTPLFRPDGRPLSSRVQAVLEATALGLQFSSEVIKLIVSYAARRLLISGSSDNTVKVWDAMHRCCVQTMSGRDEVMSMTLLPGREPPARMGDYFLSFRRA